MFGHDGQDQSQTQTGTDGMLTHTEPTVVPSSYAPPSTDDVSSPAAAVAAASAPDLPGPLPAPVADDTAVPSTDAVDDLLDIKQEALQHLSPLVGHLDQTPEEKFRTTMMMIQASDDQTLIKTAYEAAKQISDEKTRAQALLDIVNEINYFTQQHTN